MEPLDCKVSVRKYVLVSRPSKWSQKSCRVVVQSPVLNIRNTDTEIPVKRFSGEDDNSVCYLLRQDIERDASHIYDKECVSKAEVRIDAHGVAISDSVSSEELAYKRGDKFWIYVGSSTSQYTTTVPVINLRTRESG
ncbi:hypothetical protein B0O99DRAFT_501216, partial [Bisporella sp. PMI_857]